MNIAVLGPEGTFSETSLKQALTEISFNHTFVKDLGDLIPMIQTGEVDFAWLPWWNSGIGFLSDKNGNEFISQFYEGKLQIYLDAFMPLHFALLGQEGANIDDIDTIHVNPYAQEICKTFFKEHPDVKVITDTSSAKAAKTVSDLKNKNIAASASVNTGKKYNLSTLKTSMVAPNEEALMQFVLFGKPESSFSIKPTGQKITSIVFENKNVEEQRFLENINGVEVRYSSHNKELILIDIYDGSQLDDILNSINKNKIKILGQYYSQNRPHNFN